MNKKNIFFFWLSGSILLFLRYRLQNFEIISSNIYGSELVLELNDKYLIDLSIEIGVYLAALISSFNLFLLLSFSLFIDNTLYPKLKYKFGNKVFGPSLVITILHVFFPLLISFIFNIESPKNSYIYLLWFIFVTLVIIYTYIRELKKITTEIRVLISFIIIEIFIATITLIV